MQTAHARQVVPTQQEGTNHALLNFWESQATITRLTLALGISLFVTGCGRSSTSSTQSHTGQIVINPQFDGALPFSDGLAAVRIGDENSGKWGYIDKQGKFAVNPQFDGAASFSEGLAEVRIGDNKTGKWGYIDKQGKFAVNPQFDSIGAFSEGLAAVRIGDDDSGKWGFVDNKGAVVVTPQFGPADIWELSDGTIGFPSHFSEGLAEVRIGDNKTGKVGYIDKQGKFAVNPQFDSTQAFSEGLAAVRIGHDNAGKSGYIDKQGRYVVNLQFDGAEQFSDGLAAVRIGDDKTGKWGYIAR